MKIIEAIKQIKDLLRKAEDLRGMVQKASADYEHETPLYPDQRKKVSGWIQAHTDILKEVLSLKVAIQRTNLATDVTIELSGVKVTKSIAEWVYRKRELAALDLSIWTCLTDRGLKEGFMNQSTGGQKEVKIRRYYEPEERDFAVNALKSEPILIDSKLEVINAITDLIEE